MTTPKTTAAKKPATAKRPADHKTPQAKPKLVDGEYVVDIRGHEYKVPEASLDDFELLDDLKAVGEENATRFPSLLRRLVGDDGYRTAMNNLRDPETGRVGIEDGVALVRDLFEAIDPN